MLKSRLLFKKNTNLPLAKGNHDMQCLLLASQVASAYQGSR